MERIKKTALIFVILFCGGCITDHQPLKYGIQEDYLGYIPAQIAVLSCIEWPLKARFKTQLPTNIAAEDFTSLCEAFDQYVLKSFSNQPFVKGLTPKLTSKLLEQSEQSHQISEIVQIWNHDPSRCLNCRDPFSTYEESLKNNLDWRMWLNNFSKYTRYTDALLLPTIVAALERRYNDRGLLISERHLKVVILLIDTNNAHIQWIGQRSASITNQKLRSGGSEFPPYPQWDKLHERVFTNGLWIDFPGRQQNF